MELDIYINWNDKKNPNPGIYIAWHIIIISKIGEIEIFQMVWKGK